MAAHHFIAVDNIEHAASIIKSLRSSSISQQRYQRSAVRDDQIIQNLPQFNQLVAEMGARQTEQRAVEAYLERAIEMGNPAAAATAAASRDDVPARFVPPVKSAHAAAAAASSSSSSSGGSGSSSQRLAPPAQQPPAAVSCPVAPRRTDDDDIFGSDSDDDRLFDGFTAPKMNGAKAGAGTTAAATATAITTSVATKRSTHGITSPSSQTSSGAVRRDAGGGMKNHSNQHSPPVGGKLRWEDDSDDDFDADDGLSSRGTTAHPPTAKPAAYPAGAKAVVAPPAGTTGTASRVVMKPGQRPFVRAGGSKKKAAAGAASSASGMMESTF
jgi:hypothetical protein